ncbi:TIGR02300 family protein [Aureimonas phyllosphaerae]|uniref:Uncharacterized protein (TIGR02300 family) n=1 Tax=Aureimonas phyllosphaerae TaxID=1166078 RepID=A0A7W6BQD9_9HYPH|nr:TIGR02300 family protein [Aureimonas phyllosphaerae]MBB3936154.1 uncharacterized protein (TIGR02300 family) [Aureimonas phyllosphaerae]MBB3960121.1 uncharacterized protein (TIGR02300 family) [Aureimonas phyllosphaerae]SFF33478.1 TIGR02300 family protein [Aureimonas phyllosphaerae]
MAKPELGTKRIDPETGRKFYDLGKDPIVSPFTGKSYPLSFFETVKAPPRASRIKDEDEEEQEVEVTEVADTDEETVSLADVAEDEDGGSSNDLPNVDGNEDDDVIDDDDDSDDDDTFLADDEDEDDDMTDIIGGGRDDEDDA